MKRTLLAIAAAVSITAYLEEPAYSAGWQSVQIFKVCREDDCRVVVGAQMLHSQCLATSQAVAADWLSKNPGHTIEAIACVEPRRLQAYIGGREA